MSKAKVLKDTGKLINSLLAPIPIPNSFQESANALEDSIFRAIGIPPHLFDKSQCKRLCIRCRRPTFQEIRIEEFRPGQCLRVPMCLDCVVESD